MANLVKLNGRKCEHGAGAKKETDTERKSSRIKTFIPMIVMGNVHKPAKNK